MCDVLGVSPSAYYEWVAEQEAEHERRDAELRARIQALFVDFKGRYGAPRIHGELAKEGARVSRKRVARLMRESGLRAKTAKKYKATTDSNHPLHNLGERHHVPVDAAGLAVLGSDYRPVLAQGRRLEPARTHDRRLGV